MKATIYKHFLPLVLSFAIAFGILGTVGVLFPETVAVADEVPIYLDTSYTFEERTADLVSRLTLDEKISQIAYSSPEIDRYDTDGVYIASYFWGGEALHGILDSTGVATSFPIALAMANTWEPDLIQNISNAISDEARALYHSGAKGGLTYWSPTMNLARDPRWGRNEESYGEDPFLTSQIASSFVKGMQGNDSKYLKTVSTIKHFIANNSEYNRTTGTSNMSEKDMFNFYTRPYRDIIHNAGVYSVMPAYNRVNGVPMAANDYLLDKVLRKMWGFKGYVVSDCGAVNHIWQDHKWSKSGNVCPEDAVGAAITAGTDLNCGSMYPTFSRKAIDSGYMTEKDVDKAVYRCLLARMKLGEWDDFISEKKSTYNLKKEDCGQYLTSDAHNQIALDAARKSIVLLKNENNALPLDLSQPTRFAIVGEYANRNVLGDYSGTPDAKYLTTPIQGFNQVISEKGSVANMTYYQTGTGSVDTRPYLFNFSRIELLDGSGNILRTLDANNYTEKADDSLIVDEGNNFGYIRSEAWLKYGNIDLTGVKKVRAYVSMSNDAAKGGVIDVRINSRTDGSLAAKLNSPVEGTGWGDYMAVEGGYDSDVAHMASGDVYLRFSEFPAGSSLPQQSLNEIATKDAAIVYVGMDSDTMKEGHDRTDLKLPNGQASLINSVAAVNSRTIVFIQANGCVDVSEFKNNVDAILYVPHNGQAQGRACADVICGDYNPSGKLSFTWLNNTDNLDPIGEYSVSGTNGRTYQYYNGGYAYPFGYGLSYTDFTVSNCAISSNNVDVNGELTVTADVTNNGSVKGSQVVQVYVSAPKTSSEIANKTLKGFSKIYLEAGETKQVSINIKIKDLTYWNDSLDKYEVPLGEYSFKVATDADTVIQNFPVTVSGTWDEVLQAVTLESNTFILNDTAKHSTSLSVSVDNDRMLSNEYTVEYTSSNPDVVTVDENGNFSSSVEEGVATITAKVTYNGEVKEGSIAVVSQIASLSGIEPVALALNGKNITEYNPASREYIVTTTDSTAPIVDGIAAEGTTLSISQPSYEIPSIATVTASNGTSSRKYTISFKRPDVCVEDNFTSPSLNTGIWTVYNPASGGSAVRYNAGSGLTIPTTKNDMGAGANNMVLQNTSGDFAVETKIHFSTLPGQPYQQGGLVSYADDNNFVKLSLESGADYSDDMLKLVRKYNGQMMEDYAVINITKSTLTNNDFYMRLFKSGNRYSAYYSVDGTYFTYLGSVTNPMSSNKVGFYGVHVMDVPSIDATFRYFRNVQVESKAVKVNYQSNNNFLVSDDFTGESFKPIWSVENPKSYVYTQGQGITVDADVEPGYSQAYDTFIQKANGDWTAEVTAQFSELPTENYQQAALLCRTDALNFVKVSVEPNGLSGDMKQHIKFQHATNGTVDPEHMYTHDIVSGNVVNNTIILRLTKAGNKFTCQYSIDGGSTFNSSYEIDHNFSGQTYVGFYAEKVLDSAKAIKVTFKNFKSSVDQGQGALDPRFIKGDVDGDEAITSIDALNALQHSIELITLEGSRQYASDVTRDGVTNTLDALKILQRSIGMIDHF